jgi:hypothetical protein
MAEPWINKKGWLKGYVASPPPITQLEKEQEQPIDKNKKINYNNAYAKGVIFILPKCPICGNKKIKCYGTEGDTRYYKCKCGARFKAFERDIANEIK